MEPTWTWDTARAAGVLADEWLDLRYADLRYANLRGTNLRGADLTDADLHGADLTCADLHGANLTCANLTCADLTGADLRRANLTSADLRRADLTSADLHGADLTGAHLHGAHLRGAHLRGANLTGADIDFSCWPLCCGSLGVRVDKKIAVQLMYHACALNCDDSEYLAVRAACLDFANKMHRDDVPRLEFKIVETERDKNGNGNEEADHVG